MPLANEHSARMRSPAAYERFTRTNDKFGPGIHAVWGVKIVEGKDVLELQAIRFDAAKFTPAEAKVWLSEHKHSPMTFEPASETKAAGLTEWEQRGSDVQIEIKGSADAPSLVGCAIPYEVRSKPVLWFQEVIARGAASRALKQQQDVRALINHDPTLVLGRTKSGTLKLTEDDKGVHFEIQPPATSYARDLVESVRRGDIGGASFRFRVPPGGEEWEGARVGLMETRRVKDMDLADISIVTFPSYPETHIAMRSWENWKEESATIEVPIPDVKLTQLKLMEMRLELAKRCG